MILSLKYLFYKLLLLVGGYHGNSYVHIGNNVKESLKVIPVMSLNFYLMNRTDVDSSIINTIKNNVAFLNTQFNDKVEFEINKFFINEGHALLPELHNEYRSRKKLTIDSLVRNIEEKGAVNIYIFDSYVIKELNAELMGFTPVFRAGFTYYKKESPSFDRIFISYSSLLKGTTLVHEMGHFLGLEHPWEMSSINQYLMGLYNDDDIQENHMAYGLRVSKFTKEQLEKMQHFALTFRDYLLARTVYKYEHQIAYTN